MSKLRPSIFFYDADRWLLAATAAALTNGVLRVEEAISPGLPQTAVLATPNVPFFQHMIVCLWVAVLVFLGGGRLVPVAKHYSLTLYASIVVATLAAAAAQWWYPNY